MTVEEDSYEKVNYLLRLRKQIERKMIIELLNSFNGFQPVLDLTDYRYIGLGSIYYADFVLFHKYLHIKKMLSLENKVQKKMRFEYNKPYNFIDLIMMSIGDYIDKLMSWEEKIIMWLDYDVMIDDDIIDDITTISSKAKEGDFFFVTVEAKPPKKSDEIEIEKFLNKYYMYNIGEITTEKALNNFPLVVSRILSSLIHEGLRNNHNQIYSKQLFNVYYRDTKPMYTYGCVFYSENNNFDQWGVKLPKYVTEGDNIYYINCPLLTPKEKYYLDSKIDKHGKCNSRKYPTGLSVKQRESYEKSYKYYPQFFESIY